jgi:hypothetical protein
MLEMEVAESADRLIFRTRRRVDWRLAVGVAVVMGFASHLVAGNQRDWMGVASGVAIGLVLMLSPGAWTPVGEATRAGLQVGARLISVEQWAGLTYREGKGGGLFAGDFCVVADVSREDAAALVRSLKRIAG